MQLCDEVRVDGWVRAGLLPFVFAGPWTVYTPVLIVISRYLVIIIGGLVVIVEVEYLERYPLGVQILGQFPLVRRRCCGSNRPGYRCVPYDIGRHALFAQLAINLVLRAGAGQRTFGWGAMVGDVLDGV